MPEIIKDKQIVDDNWVNASETETFPDGDIIVTWPQWQENKDTLSNRNIALQINGDDDLAEVIKEIDHFSFIAIEFKEFKDGRGYSYARLLRERYNYKGDLRAVGDVLRDQMFYMQRCGFNAFEAKGDLKGAIESLNDFSSSYQPQYNSSYNNEWNGGINNS